MGDWRVSDKPKTAEKFRGMRWLFLRDNTDSFASRRGTSEIKPRQTFETMPEIYEESPEKLLERTYAKVAAKLKGLHAVDDRESHSDYLQEVKDRKQLQMWNEGKFYRRPVVAKLQPHEQGVLRSNLANPLNHQMEIRNSARNRLESIFHPTIWTQLQDIKRQNSSAPQEIRKITPISISTARSVHTELNNSAELPSVTRRKQYGKWYLPTADWNTRFRKLTSDVKPVKS